MEERIDSSRVLMAVSLSFTVTSSLGFCFARLQVFPPLLLRESLDGVPEHRPWHHPTVFAQERLQHRHVPLPDFPQHPADRLVDQVLLVRQQLLGDPERVGEVAVTDETSGWPRC